MRRLLFLFTILVCWQLSPAPQSMFTDVSVEYMESRHRMEQWVDSVYRQMTPDQRIGQLFMVAAYSNRGPEHLQQLEKLVTDYAIGGLIFFQGGPVRQARMTNYLQQKAKIPLFIAMDAEWGLAMRLDSTIAFPRQLTLGAIEDDALIFDMGMAIGEQCKRLGIHINLAPVVDVNNNPLNPVINTRSFGEDKGRVAEKGMAYMLGMQHTGIITVAKHFPGHGDTDADSHKTLPVINHSRKRLEEIELYPFEKLIDGGVDGIMAAHLYVPALDVTEGQATSLSPIVIKDLLKDKMGFKGLVFSDALNMKGVSDYYAPGEVDLKAFLAGNDILLFSQDVPEGIRRIREALDNGIAREKDLEESVKKILRFKYKAGLYRKPPPIEIKHLIRDLNDAMYQALNRRLYEHALTLAKDDSGWIPYRFLDTLELASVVIGSGGNDFQETLSLYTHFDHYRWQVGDDGEALLEQFAGYDHVIAGLTGMSSYASRQYGLQQEELDFLNALRQKTDVTLVVFGSPYSLKFFGDFPCILVANEENAITRTIAPQALFGGIPLTGSLPVSSGVFTSGQGVKTGEPIRLKYTIPEETGIRTRWLKGIDSIAQAAIASKATPGCQILFALDGKVIYHKAFGYHTYAKKRPVRWQDLYDLASVTKIAATAVSLMYLYDLKQFKPNRKLSDYLPDLENTPLEDVQIKDVLTHQAGLVSWIPFYLKTLKDSIYDWYYCDEAVGCFKIPVAQGLYASEDLRDTIFHTIKHAPVNPKKEYKYSDLGFYLLWKIIEDITRQPFEQFAHDHFYAPLGMDRTAFKPAMRFPLDEITPTEDDKVFRKRLVHGYVHDPGAALLGGVSGHAGLFSNANDMAKMMQMLLNGGEYGGDRFIRKSTVEMFTRRQNKGSRRGLAFDKPETDPDKISPACASASPATFGHTGFTGTAVWADPEYQLIFVFLSNRVHPDMGNYKLIEQNVRTNIQQVMYDAIARSRQNL